jgi:uncharacterized protein YbjT (DUF2867 family)
LLILSPRKAYVVTDGTAGIGIGIVAHLLQHRPSKIYILSQKPERTDSAIVEVKIMATQTTLNGSNAASQTSNKL